MAEERENPPVPQNRLKRSPRSTNAETDSILSPRFRSAAAMAGWDEEALLLATLVVEDTPVRESLHRKRRIQQLKSPPPTSSNRRRRSRQRPADSIPAVVLCLDDDEEVPSHQEVESKEKKTEEGSARNDEKQGDVEEGGSAEIASGKGLPCMDRLREELSCAICLEICYEPSTTPCGHSFCKKCLKCAADKCGKKCPKCRQLISNGRSCTVNTVLWNTIQLLFPEEVEARKKAAICTSSRKEVSKDGLELERNGRDTRGRNRHSSSSRDVDIPSSTSFRTAIEVLGGAAEGDVRRRRRRPIQSEDAALAHRLQREEFLEAFGNSSSQQRNSLYATRERLRTIAFRMRNTSSHA